MAVPRFAKASLVYARERGAFRYAEHARVSVKDGCVLVNGEPAVPGCLSCLLLGAGSSITHDAAMALNDLGVALAWTSHDGLSLHSVAIPSTADCSRIAEQASLVATRRGELVRKLFRMRYPDVTGSIPDTRTGFFMEESRLVKAGYAGLAHSFGVKWNGRVPRVKDMVEGDIVNRAITYGNIVLYSVASAVIYMNGLLPQLGILHSRGLCPLAYDIADVVKMETTVPYAFEYAARHSAFDTEPFYTGLAILMDSKAVTGKLSTIVNNLFG